MDNASPISFKTALRELRLTIDDIEWEGGTPNVNMLTTLAYYQERVDSGGAEAVAYWTNKHFIKTGE